MNNAHPLPKKTNGFSLIEILLVIGVIAVLAIAAFMIYGKVRAAGQAQAAASSMRTVAAGLRGLAAGNRGNYAGFNESLANRAHLFPARMNGGNYTAGATITNEWGEGVVIANSTQTSPGFAPGFLMVWRGMPSEVCLRLPVMIEREFDKITLNNGTNSAVIKDISNPAKKRIDTGYLINNCTQSNWISLMVEGK